MADQTEIFVVGGGPAGLAAGIAARKKGFRVTVADAGVPPIDKACGEGLLPETVGALARLGVTFGALDGRAVRGIRFVTPAGGAEAKFPGGPARGVRRMRLHKILADAAASCGVNILWNSRVTGLSSGGVLVEGKVIPARWIIGADGGQSRVRRWAGLDVVRQVTRRFSCRGHFRVRPWTDFVEVHWGEGMQAYVTPVGVEEIGIAILSRDPRLQFAGALRKFPALERHLHGAEPTSAPRGAVTATLQLKRVAAGRVALVGDASGTVDAITGEGLGLAFRQAEALAEALAAEDLDRYQAEHRRLAKHPTMMARLLLVLDRHENIRRRTMRVFQNRPELFASILALHIGTKPKVELLTTGFRLGWHMLTTKEDRGRGSAPGEFASHDKPGDGTGENFDRTAREIKIDASAQ